MAKQTGRKARAVSLADASRLLGRHRNSVSQWLSEGCPYVEAADRSSGKEWALDLGELLEWREARASAAERERLKKAHAKEIEKLEAALEAAGQDKGGPIPMAEAKRRTQVARMRVAEVEADLAAGRAFPTDQVDKVLATLVLGTRDRLLAVPTKTAHEHVGVTTPGEHHDIADKAIRGALQDLAKAGREMLAHLEKEGSE